MDDRPPPDGPNLFPGPVIERTNVVEMGAPGLIVLKLRFATGVNRKANATTIAAMMTARASTRCPRKCISRELPLKINACYVGGFGSQYDGI